MNGSVRIVISIALLMLMGLISATSQTTWEVTVSNFSFSPAELTINVGDEVVWNNTMGTHNVNGTQETFPDNPESFGNTVRSSPWEYRYTFSVAGNYSYQCNPHSSQMQGTITVNTATFIRSSLAKLRGIQMYPLPVVSKLTIELEKAVAHNYEKFEIYDLTGQKIHSSAIKNSELIELNLSYLSPSIYIYRFYQSNGVITSGKLIKK